MFYGNYTAKNNHLCRSVDRSLRWKFQWVLWIPVVPLGIWKSVGMIWLRCKEVTTVNFPIFRPQQANVNGPLFWRHGAIGKSVRLSDRPSHS